MAMIPLNKNFSKKNFTAICTECGEDYSAKRKALGFADLTFMLNSAPKLRLAA